LHTVIVIAIGFVTLGVGVFAGDVLAGRAGIATAALIFLPVWLAGAGVNLLIGVKRAGYSVSEEFPILLVVFAVPAIAALITWWRLRAAV
jgi:hypothetical protein